MEWKHIMMLLVAWLALSGCADVLQEDSGTQKSSHGDAYIDLSLSVVGSESGNKRAGNVLTGNEVSTGTDEENKIHSLFLIMLDVDDEAEGEKDYPVIRAIAPMQSGEKQTIAFKNVRAGKKHLFLAANLTQEQVNRFNSEMATLKTKGTDYEEMINELVPESNGFSTKVDQGILMTGQGRDATSSSVDLTLTKKNTIDNPLQVKVDMTRAVAKVLVLAKPMEEGSTTYEDYAQVEGSLSASDGIAKLKFGWIPIQDIRFSPNTVNRSLYFVGQKDNTKQKDNTNKQTGKDLNMYVGPYLKKDQFDANSFSYDKSACNRDFVGYDSKELHDRNVRGLMMQASKYDDSKMQANQNNGVNRYTSGMYMTENFFSTEKGGTDGTVDSLSLVNSESAIPFITTVTIAARIIPTCLMVEDNFYETMQVYCNAWENEGEAQFENNYPGIVFDKTDYDRWQKIKENKSYNWKTDISTTSANGCYLVRFSNNANYKDGISDCEYVMERSLKNNKMWSSNEDEYMDDKYPSGTYFYYDFDSKTTSLADQLDCKYLTAGAYFKTENKVIKGGSVPYSGGWGYYYTYIDENNTGNNKIAASDSQVTRNHYYLITVNKFTKPGNTITDPSYIRCNTQTVNWIYAGRGNVSLH